MCKVGISEALERKTNKSLAKLVQSTRSYEVQQYMYKRKIKSAAINRHQRVVTAAAAAVVVAANLSRGKQKEREGRREVEFTLHCKNRGCRNTTPTVAGYKRFLFSCPGGRRKQSFISRFLFKSEIGHILMGELESKVRLNRRDGV